MVPRRSAPRVGVIGRIVLDSEGLSRAADGSRPLRQDVLARIQLGGVVAVSTVTLAEVLRGHTRDDTDDAIVIATAATLPAPVTVLTSDPGDLTALSGDLPGVVIEKV